MDYRRCISNFTSANARLLVILAADFRRLNSLVVHCRAITLIILIRGWEVLAITCCPPRCIRGTLQEMLFLSAQSLDASAPVPAVHATHCFALKIGLHGLELRVRVVVRWTRHRCDGEPRIVFFAGNTVEILQTKLARDSQVLFKKRAAKASSRSVEHEADNHSMGR